MKSYKDLVAYQKGYKLALETYQGTRNYPKEEIYGLVSQMRRSAVSIPCNIAEGYRRGHRKEYIHFLHIALGSCGELETLLSYREIWNLLTRTDQKTFTSYKKRCLAF